VRRAVLLLVLLTLAACGSGGAGGTGASSNAPPAAAISADIQSRLTARPDVASAEVHFGNGLDDYATAHVQVTVRGGADLDAVYDDAVRLTWLSRLNPLHRMTVDLSDAADPTRGGFHQVDLQDAAVTDRLQQQYGPHPR
jgi:hypothetical protein